MPVIRTTDDGRAMFWCPGCKQYHGPKVKGDGPWEWNGDRDKPTFSPSILVRWTRTPNDSDLDRIMAGEGGQPVAVANRAPCRIKADHVVLESGINQMPIVA